MMKTDKAKKAYGSYYSIPRGVLNLNVCSVPVLECLGNSDKKSDHTSFFFKSEEDIEKYIFDPKDPKKCKVYGLLLNILKEGNFETLMSPLFFLQFYKDDLEKRFESEIWDKPDNYYELNLDKKIELFIEQNSANDLFIDRYFIGKKYSFIVSFYDKYLGKLNGFLLNHKNKKV